MAQITQQIIGQIPQQVNEGTSGISAQRDAGYDEGGNVPISGYQGVFNINGQSYTASYDSEGNLNDISFVNNGVVDRYVPGVGSFSEKLVGKNEDNFFKDVLSNPITQVALAYYLPGVGEALGAQLGVSSAVGTALASTAVQVANGVDFDTALKNATVNAVVQTGSPTVANDIAKAVGSTGVADAVTSAGASIASTLAKGGNMSEALNNAGAAIAASGASQAADSRAVGAAVGGGITGGTTGALTQAAGVLGAPKTGDTTTTAAPTTSATLTPNLTDAQVSQIQNALGISVSDATNNDVKLALGPLLVPLGAAAEIVSDSLIPLIGIFGAKAVSDTIDYYKNQKDSAGFYKWVNENMQAADDRVQNKLSLNPAGAGRGFVNPPVATTITPSQAAVSRSYGAGFFGAGGGAGAGVTAGEGTAGEAEAKDFLAAQKVTHPEIDFETLAKEPALNELPADKKIADLIQPGAASTAAAPPGTAPADRDILNLTGITQPTSTPARAPGEITAPTTLPATTPEIVKELPPPVLPVLPPVVEPPPVVSEPPPPDVPPPPPPPPPPKVVVDPEPPPLPPDEPPPPPPDEPPPDEPPPDEPPPDEPDVFIYGKVTPKTKTRTTTNLGTTLQAPFYPTSTLGQALTGYRGAGEIEGESGINRKNVWNEASLRLKDALGI